MSRQPAPCKARDVGDSRTVTLGGVESLVGATAVAHLRQVAEPNTVDTLPASITDAEARTVEVDLGTAPGDWLPAGPAVGQWQVEIAVSFGDGSVLTFRNDGYDILKVNADIA